jgi:hypothetical protein
MVWRKIGCRPVLQQVSDLAALHSEKGETRSAFCLPSVMLT